MTGWSAVHRALRRGDLGALERLLLDPSLERTEVAQELGELTRNRSRRDWSAMPNAEAHGIALIIVAALPTPAPIVVALSRRPLLTQLWNAPVDALVRVALARDVPWHAELGRRLLERATPASAELYPFAATLLARTGTPAPQPVPAGAVVGWLEAARARLQGQGVRTAETAADALLADPLRLQPLPGLFTDGVERGLALQVQVDHRGTSLLPAGIAVLATRGLVDRSVLLAGAVERLLRGGSAADLRPYVLLLDHLAPTLAEWEPHGSDLVALTGSEAGAVAAEAQSVLHRLHGYGRVSDEAVLEASATLLRRSGKGTARAALSRLERMARRDDVDVEALARAAAAGFDHPSHDVAERALALVAAALPSLDESDRQDLAAAAVLLDPALAQSAREVFGGPSDAVPTGRSTPPVAAPVPGSTGGHGATAVASFGAVGPAAHDSRPRPVRTPWPVADADPGEVASLLRGDHGSDLVAWESAFAGLIRLRATDPAGLREAVADVGVEGWLGGPQAGAIRTRLLREIRDDSLGGFADSVRSFFSRLTGSSPARPTAEPSWDVPDGMLVSPLPHLARLAEAAKNLRDRPVPMLVATPSHTDGSIAVEVLLDRLTRAAHECWQPWPIDLEQALLRVTVPFDRVRALDLARAAHALATPAATALARWLEQGGLPDPEVTVSRVVPEPDGYDGGHPGSWLAPTVAPRAAPPGPLTAALLDIPVTGVVQRHGNGVERPSGNIGWLDLVPLPHHPEVQAAWMLPALTWYREYAGRPSAVALQSFDGRAGTATGAVLAQLLLGEADARTTAVDVALHLTGVGQQWGAWTALRVVDAVRHGSVLTRAVEPLRTIAAGGGAHEVLVLLVTALPPLVVAAVRGLPDALALTTSLVVEHGIPEHAGPELPEALGSFTGRSRTAQESRRLLEALKSQER